MKETKRTAKAARRPGQIVPARFDASLRLGEDPFRLLAEGVHDYAIFLLDDKGYVSTWNSGATRIEGSGTYEIVGRHFSVLYSPDERAAGKPDCQLALAAKNGRSEYEGWRTRADGTRFWATIVITALYDAEKNVCGYGMISSDMSAHRLAYRELRDREERFRCAFDEAPIGMVMFDLDGRYERVNDAFCAIVGYESERLTGLASKEITHPDDIATDEAAAHALLAGNAKSRSYEKRFLHAAGHVVWASFDITLVCNREDQGARFVAQIQDITKHRMYQRQLEYMADHDALTGLLNRRGFQRELESHIARIVRYGLIGSILMIDLDNFKIFNDNLGHAAGDRLLVNVARGLESRLRESDVLARLGGDEFAVLLPHGDDQVTQHAADALLRVVRELPMATAFERNTPVTASIGIAHFDETAETAEEIMVNADVAMYDAKETGRDRSSRYRNELRDVRRLKGR